MYETGQWEKCLMLKNTMLAEFEVTWSSFSGIFAPSNPEKFELVRGSTSQHVDCYQKSSSGLSVFAVQPLDAKRSANLIWFRGVPAHALVRQQIKRNGSETFPREKYWCVMWERKLRGKKLKKKIEKFGPDFRWGSGLYRLGHSGPLRPTWADRRYGHLPPRMGLTYQRETTAHFIKNIE